MQNSLIRFLLLSLALVLPSLAEPAKPPPDLSEIDREAAPIPVYEVPATEAAIDGNPRAELGASLADSLAQGLLSSGNAKVVEGDKANFRLTSRMAGESSSYRLTVRKVNTLSNEVEAIYSASAEGESPDIFGLVDDILGQMTVRAPLPALDAPVKATRPRKIIPWIPPLTNVREETRPAIPMKQPVIQEPPVYERPDFERKRVGILKTVDDEWQFVVIQPDGEANIRPHEMLEIVYDGTDGPQPYARLEIDRMSDDKIIANFGSDPRGDRILFPGEIVYAWRQK